MGSEFEESLSLFGKKENIVRVVLCGCFHSFEVVKITLKNSRVRMMGRKRCGETEV